MTARPTKRTILALFSVLYVLDCSGKTVNDVGGANTQTAGSGGTGGSAAAAGAPAVSLAGSSTSDSGAAGVSSAGTRDAGAPAGSSTSDSGAAGVSSAGTGDAGAPDGIDGTWRGYIENYKNSDLTDTAEVRISMGGLAGQIVFGEVMAPPAATDPQADYPPPSSTNMGGPGYTSGPDAGFVFTMMGSSFNGKRLQFDVAPNELYQSWCSLQTPYKDDLNVGDNYYCLPNWSFAGDGTSCWQTDPMTMEKVARSCTQLRLCTPGATCACTPTSCTAHIATSVHFDLMLAFPKADGSIVGLDSNVHNVHLTKQ